jgi:hypothetical protein
MAVTTAGVNHGEYVKVSVVPSKSTEVYKTVAQKGEMR